MDLRRETIKNVPDSSLQVFVREQGAWPFSWHQHAEIEITLIYAGQGVCVVGDQFEPYQAGDGFFIGGELPHTWASQGPGPHRAVVVQVHPRILQGLADVFVELHSLRALMKQAERGLRFPASVFQRLCEDMLNGDPLERVQHAIRALCQLVDSAPQPILSAPWHAMNDGDKRLDAFMRWLEAEAHRAISLSEAAQVLKMSPGGLSRFLKQASGRTFTELVQSLRLSRAASQLLASDDRVLDIALNSGFGSLAQFNKCFKQRFHVTPALYRRGG